MWPVKGPFFASFQYVLAFKKAVLLLLFSMFLAFKKAVILLLFNLFVVKKMAVWHTYHNASTSQRSRRSSSACCGWLIVAVACLP